MSNLVVNWRFGRWFFQVVRPSDWGRVDEPVRFSSVPGPRPGFAIYQGKAHFALMVISLGLTLWALL